MKRLCSICARGGSKGVPGKNLREIMGKPLIALTIADARDSGLFDVVAVSSDSDAILDAARAHGADALVKRPDDLASDTAGKPPAIHHCGLTVEATTGLVFDTFVDLDATAPLRTVADVRGIVEKLEAGPHGNLFSVCRSRRSPYFNMVEEQPDGRIALVKEGRFVRRQDAPVTYDMNASMYAWTRASFMANAARVFNPDAGVFVMHEHSLFDIDDAFDFEIVSLIAPRIRGGGAA